MRLTSTSRETSNEALSSVIDTNIKGMIMGSQVAAAHMIEQGSGQIFNMEGLGSNGMIQKRTVLYGMTKSALSYFTKGLAKELAGSGVLAGRISPGMMLTEFITKTPSGEPSPVLTDPHFKKVFNILATQAGNGSCLSRSENACQQKAGCPYHVANEPKGKS